MPRTKRMFFAERLSLAVPTALTISQESRVDFVLVEFRDSDKLVLSAYFGNAPWYPGELSEPAQRMMTIGPFSAKERLGRKEAPYLKEILVAFTDVFSPKRWPICAHFTVARGSPEQVQAAQDIVESMRRLAN
jgi:hypothetical protein